MRVASIQRQGPHIPGFTQAADVLITADGTTPVRLWYDALRTNPAPNPFPLVNGFNAFRGAGCQIFCAESTFQIAAFDAEGAELYRIADGSALNISEILAALTTAALVAKAGSTLTGPVTLTDGGVSPQMYSRAQLDALLEKTESATFVIASVADLNNFFANAAGYDFRVVLVLPGSYTATSQLGTYYIPTTCRYLYGIRGTTATIALQPLVAPSTQVSINYPVLAATTLIDVADVSFNLVWTGLPISPAASDAWKFRGIELQGQSTIQRVRIVASCTRHINFSPDLYASSLTVLVCADIRDVDITLQVIQNGGGYDGWQYVCAVGGTAYGAQFCNVGFHVTTNRHNRIDYVSAYTNYLFRTDTRLQGTAVYVSTPEFITDLSQVALSTNCIPIVILEGLTIVGAASDSTMLTQGFASDGIHSNGAMITLRGRIRLSSATARRSALLFAAIDATVPGLVPVDSKTTLRLTGIARRLRPTTTSCGVSNVIVAPLSSVALSSVATSAGSGDTVATDCAGVWLRINGQLASSGSVYYFSVDDGATWTATAITTGGYGILGIEAGQGGYWRVRLTGNRLQRLYFNGTTFTNLGALVYSSAVIATFDAALPANDASPMLVTASNGVYTESGANTLTGYGTTVFALSRGYNSRTLLNINGANAVLCMTEDNGATWRTNAVAQPYAGTLIAVLHVTKSNYVLVATDGVWHTINEGVTWTQITGLTLTGVTITAAAIGGGRLYVGGAYSGASWLAHIDVEGERSWTVVTTVGGTRVTAIALDYMGVVTLVGVLNATSTTATVVVYNSVPSTTPTATLTLAGVTPVRKIVTDGAGNFMLTSDEASVTNYIMRLCFSTWTHPYITGTGASVHADAYPGQTQIVDNTAAGGWNN